jgi:predicted amidohydrolase YtcJ
VDVDTALRLVTATPAHAAFQEHDLGALTVGRYADFTALSADPRTHPADQLQELDIRMTVVAGEMVFGSPQTRESRRN